MKLDNKLKNEIVKRLTDLNPKMIFLFGSYASGTPDKDSDIDLLIVKDEVNSKHKEMIEARKLLSGLEFAFDTLVTSTEEYNFYKDQAGSVYREINNKGIILYEKQ